VTGQPSVVTSQPKSSGGVTSSTSSTTSTPASAATNSAHTYTTPASQLHGSRLSAGAEAGIAIGVIIAVAAVGLGIFLLLRRRKAQSLQNHGTTFEDDLPVVHTLNGGKPTLFSGLAAKLGRRKHVSGVPAENSLHTNFAEVTSMKRTPQIQEVGVPAELSSDNQVVAQLVSPNEEQVHEISSREFSELPESTGSRFEVQDSSLPLAELRSDTASPKPAMRDDPSANHTIPSAVSGVSNVPPSFPGQYYYSTPSSEPPEPEVEDLAKLKEAAARLEERRKRLHELNKIEDEEESLRKKIAGLERKD
jgi:hypothetical protein